MRATNDDFNVGPTVVCVFTECPLLLCLFFRNNFKFNMAKTLVFASKISYQSFILEYLGDFVRLDYTTFSKKILVSNLYFYCVIMGSSFVL